MDNYNDGNVLVLKSKDRLKSFDCLKLFAIFLVIWGHSIQYFLSSMYYEEPVYRIIYSFHMPLFMMISGYFSLSSMSLSPLVFLKKKFIQLLLPTFSWIIVLGLIKIPFKTCCFTENYEIIALSLKNTISEIITGFYGTYPFWFLKTCFVCFLLAYCGSHLRLNKYVWMIITIILSQFISHFALFGIMYPCFVIGMELKDNQRFFKHICKNYYWYLGVFFLMLCFWNRSFWTYDGPYRDMLISVLHVLHANNSFMINNAFGLYRLTIGIIGSLAIIGLFCSLIPQEKNDKIVLLCGNWGQYTLGIYILQSIILETIMAKYICLDNVNFFVFNFIIAPLLSLLVLVLCVSIIKLMSKSPILGFIFFGNSKK